MKEKFYRYGLVLFGCAFWIAFRLIYGWKSAGEISSTLLKKLNGDVENEKFTKFKILFI